MSSSAAAQIAARLDRLPSSRAVWTIVVLISLGGVFEFYDLFFTAYIAPGMLGSGLFTAESLGFFSSLDVVRVSGFGTFVFCTFAGLWVGVVAFGHCADRFGRKAVFTWSLIWYVAATAIMAFQRTGQWVNVWRFVAGVGFGVQLVTVDTYIVELTPRSLRGRAFCVNQCICFGIVPVVALFGWLLVPRAPLGFAGWRWVVLFGTAGAIAVWALRSGIPESPRWLAERGRLEEAERIVAGIERRVAAEARAGAEARTGVRAGDEARFGAGPRVAATAGGWDATPGAAEPLRADAPQRASLADIFTPRYRGRTLMLSVFNAAQVIGFYGFNSWLPTLITARGITVTHGLQYAFVIAIAQPLGPLLGTLFADRVERKTQIIAGLACMGAAMGAFAVATRPPALIALGIVFTLAANLMSYAYHGYQAELFPTRIRARAVGFVYSWSRLAAAFAGLFVGFLLADGGVPAVAVFIGGGDGRGHCGHCGLRPSHPGCGIGATQ
jgi:putative MFS transporter